MVQALRLLCLSLAVVALVLQTRRQTKYWQSDETLLLHTLDVDREQNIDIHRALGLYYWEEKHDLEKVYEHLKKALDYARSETVRDSLSVSALILIEACYATGRAEEADDYYCWFRKIDYRECGEDSSPEFLMAEALYLLHSQVPDRQAQVSRILETVKGRSQPSLHTRDHRFLSCNENR